MSLKLINRKLLHRDLQQLLDRIENMKNPNKFDMLKTIIEKFLAWDSDCKDWSFKIDYEVSSVIVITTRILDRHNDYVELFAHIYRCECCNELTFMISDLGFIAHSFKEMKKESIFIDPLQFTCTLDNFSDGMDYYFGVLSIAGTQIGFHKIDINEEKKVLQEEKK